MIRFRGIEDWQLASVAMCPKRALTNWSRSCAAMRLESRWRSCEVLYMRMWLYPIWPIENAADVLCWLSWLNLYWWSGSFLLLVNPKTLFSSFESNNSCKWSRKLASHWKRLCWWASSSVLLEDHTLSMMAGEVRPPITYPVDQCVGDNDVMATMHREDRSPRRHRRDHPVGVERYEGITPRGHPFRVVCQPICLVTVSVGPPNSTLG